MNDTQILRREVIRILGKSKKSMAFNEIWDASKKNWRVKKVMYNSDGSARYGLLWGILTKAKRGKVGGIRYLKRENKYVLTDCSLNLLDNQIINFLEDSEKLIRDVDNKVLNEEEMKRLEKIIYALEILGMYKRREEG